MNFLSGIFWYGALLSLFTYCLFLFFGNIFYMETRAPIILRDVLRPGEHHISGIVMVPSPCVQLSVKSRSLGEYAYNIMLQTWQDPSIDCPYAETPRSFGTIVYGPSIGVTFVLTLNGVPQRYDYLPVLPQKRTS